MSKSTRRGLVSGLCLAIFLAVGLEPVGWLFYEASHLPGLGFLYPLYSLFRGGGYLLSIQNDSWLIYLTAGLASGLLVYFISKAIKR